MVLGVWRICCNFVGANVLIRKMKRILLLLLVAAQVAAAFGGKHVIISDTLFGSKIYPGTMHALQVYVPDQYDGKEPACLYVGLDGILCNAPSVMDTLIAQGKMPVTIGVFLQPGVVTDAAGTVVRYNRSNEFDRTSPLFAEFLEKEVLPEVKKLSDGKGVPLLISHHTEDHMIFGLSSGGIAAFMAAWHRPDLFSRVFSGVGTFVGMRGGDEVPVLVRKGEPRALKVCLQDGTADAWNPLFGHWYEGNQMLASALDFAGYKTKYDWSDTGHSVTRAAFIFQEVMEWMWNGWPADVVPGSTKNDLLAKLLVPDSEWEVCDSVVKKPASWGNLVYYPDMSLAVKAAEGSNCLNQVIVDDGQNMYEQPFYWLHSFDNAQLEIGPMEFDADGNLWVVTNAGIQICDQNGRVRGMVMLPRLGEEVAWKAIKIQDGSVQLFDDRENVYTRPFHVQAPRGGVRPKSQGQG